jgi:hypothetical protein
MRHETLQCEVPVMVMRARTPEVTQIFVRNCSQNRNGAGRVCFALSSVCRSSSVKKARDAEKQTCESDDRRELVRSGRRWREEI